MATPVHLGQIVLHKTSASNSLHPAIVTEIPLIQADGSSNFDPDGNPYAANLMVLNVTANTRYHVPHRDSRHSEFFIHLSEAPHPSVQDVESVL